MKALVVSISLVCALACAMPARAYAFTSASTVIILVTPHVVQAVLDLQDAWNCYLEGFRRRHPSPRPAVPRPDAVPASPPDSVPAPHTLAPAEP